MSTLGGKDGPFLFTHVESDITSLRTCTGSTLPGPCTFCVPGALVPGGPALGLGPGGPCLGPWTQGPSWNLGPGALWTWGPSWNRGAPPWALDPGALLEPWTRGALLEPKGPALGLGTEGPCLGPWTRGGPALGLGPRGPLGTLSPVPWGVPVPSLSPGPWILGTPVRSVSPGPSPGPSDSARSYRGHSLEGVTWISWPVITLSRSALIFLALLHSCPLRAGLPNCGKTPCTLVLSSRRSKCPSVWFLVVH